MENRRVNIKVTSNAKKVMSDMGQESQKQGKKTTGILAKIKGLAGGIGNGFTAAAGGVRAFSAALISSGVGAFVVAAGSLVALLSKALNTSKDFEKALSGLKAITGATDEEMQALSHNARELGRSTAFTASQVVELQTEFSKLGFTTGEILDATEATLALAAASGTDLADAATVAGNTIRAFGFDASETGRVADVMAKSFTSSALDMEKFRESMKLVAPIAKTTKVTLEEASAALSILADRGVSGSMAGTQLRRVMSDLAQKTGKDFATSLEITADRLDKAGSTAEKLAIAKELVGDRAKGSLIALAENREQLDLLKVAYEGAGGAAQAMAEEQLNNLSGDLTKLSSAWEGFLLGLEDGEGVLNGLARGAVQFLTNSLGFLTKASESVADAFRVNFASAKRVASVMVERIKETFTNAGLNITRFAQKAKLAIADIPFIGKAIDKEATEANLRATETLLEESNARLQELADKANNESVLKAEHYAKLKADREIKIEQKKKAAIDKINTEDEFVEGSSSDDDDKLKARLEKEAEIRAKFKRKLFEAERDQDAQSDLEKNELARKRHLEELDRIKMEETQKRELVERINDLYNKKADAINEEQRVKDKSLKDQSDADRLEAEKQLQDKRVQMAQNTLDSLARLAGEETKMGKLILAAKAALQIREQIMDAKDTIAKAKKAAIEAKLDAASAGVSLTKGSAKAAATLNPAIIATYALTAASVGVSIASAVSAMKKATSEANAGAAIDTPNLSTGKSNNAPSFNVVGRTSAGERLVANTIREAQGEKVIKAFVVSNEVKTALDLQEQIGSKASMG